MKKKILSLTLVVCLLAIAVVGGTLAYFTDVTETKENVFTVGNVNIDLIEEFDEENARLLPGSKTENAINKDVSVKNVGTNDAWVRVKVYVPAHLDVLTQYPDDYEVTAIGNILHWNIVAGVDELWNVDKACWEAKPTEDGKYNEYVFYYNKAISYGEETAQLLDQVYLDSKVDYNANTQQYMYNGQVVDLSDVKINVVAEAIQADGFDGFEDAFAAFDAQVH